MDYELISQTALFQGCSPSETEKLLHGLKTFTKKYKKGEHNGENFIYF